MMSSIVRAVAVTASLVLAAFHADAHPHNLPETIALPLGFQPEGIAPGPGGTLLVGSIPTGAIYKVDPRSGQGETLVEAHEGRMAIGLKRDGRSNHIYVAGGATGKVFVYDAKTGADVAVLQATDDPATFVNDVVITRRAVYFTDSFRPVFYRLPLGANGEIAGNLESVTLSGDYGFLPGEFNANGIVASHDGKSLIIVHSTLGELYRVNPKTGEAVLIELEGDAAASGDGLLLVGCKLYIVQNFANQVAVVHLSEDLSTGTLVDVLQDDDFDVPTTIARLGHALYAVNARFSTPATPETAYDIVRVQVHD